MVIDQFHVAGVRPVKAEDDTPVTRDLNRPVAGTVTLQLMEPKAGGFMSVGVAAIVEAGQDAVDFPGEM